MRRASGGAGGEECWVEIDLGGAGREESLPNRLVCLVSCEGFLLSTYANTYGYTGLDMGFCGPRIYLIKLIMGKTKFEFGAGGGGCTEARLIRHCSWSGRGHGLMLGDVYILVLAADLHRN